MPVSVTILEVAAADWCAVYRGKVRVWRGHFSDLDASELVYLCEGRCVTLTHDVVADESFLPERL